MRLKQKLSATLVVLLVLLHSFPAFAIASSEPSVQMEAVTIQDSGTPSEPSSNQNKPSDAEPEQGDSQTNEPATPPELELSGNDSDPIEPTTPQGISGMQTTPDTQPLKAPVITLEEQGELPIFSTELVKGGERPGLYGTLSYIPKNAMNISVEYSFGGGSYYFVEDGLWELDEATPSASPPTQLCMELDEGPYTAWQSGAVNSLYIRLSITCNNSPDIRTKPVKYSNGKTYPLPETPPAFTAELVYSHGGYQVNGHFEDFPADVVSVRPMYSLDGQEYKAVQERYKNYWQLKYVGTEDEDEKRYLENQCCITYSEEPLKSYVAGRLDRFYILLEVTTESDGYLTQADVIERGTAKPVPEGASFKAAFPFTMRPLDEWGNLLDVTYGQYQVTVREGATAEQILSLLPNTLPVQVQLWQGNPYKMLTSGIVQVPVTWKAPPTTQLIAGQQVIISNAVGALVVPSGTELTTPLGNFPLDETVEFDADRGQVRLVVDVVGKDEAPDVSLQENSIENSIDDIGALSLAFRLKPSGATSITAYSIVDGDEGRTELFDLLDRRDLNHNQSVGLYGFVTLLQPEDAPFHGYLSKEIPFSIGLDIEGGTFDGKNVVLRWPGEYTPPNGIPEPGGSEGNEGNAGSDDGSGDSNEGGQRPDIPDGGVTTVTVPPPDTASQPMPTTVPDAVPTTTPDAMPPTAEHGKDTPPLVSQPSTEPEADKSAGVPVWSEAKLQGETQEKSVGLSVTTAVLLLGGGISAVAVVGAGGAAGGMAGTSTVAKLLTALKNLLGRP